MRKLLLVISIFVFIGFHFCSAQRLRDRIRKVNDIDSYDENVPYVRKQRGIPAVQFTETGSNGGDIIANNRRKRAPKMDENGRQILKELKGDLSRIRGFAQRVRPIVKNLRRAMKTRKNGLAQEITVITEYLKKTMSAAIDSAEKYLTVLKPVTKYLREIIEKLFENN